MHEERKTTEPPILHVATCGPITMRVYRGEPPHGRVGLYERIANRDGYYLEAGTHNAAGQFEPATMREVGAEAYPYWETAFDECFWFISAQLGYPTVPAKPGDGRIAFDTDDQRRFRKALGILRGGGDVRSKFLTDATELLLESSRIICSDRFVYASGLRELTAAEWDSVVMVTHAATFACRLADTLGAEAQDHIEGWLQDAIPVLARIAGEEEGSR